jgi:GNAT superfamily N-acetyltransferase
MWEYRSEVIMEIRLATLEDVTVISKMYEEFFAFHAGLQPTYFQEAEEHGEYPESTIKSETADLIVSEVDGNVVGFAHVLESKSLPYDCIVQYKIAVCIDLYVKPAYRKMGVATELLKAVKEWAKKRDLDFIEIKVLVENDNAINFYEREGYNKIYHTMRYLI